MAQNLYPKKQNFLSNCVSAVDAFLEAYNQLRQVRAEYASEGYSFVQADIDPLNVNQQPTPPVAHLTPTIVVNLMSTFDTIDSLINSNTANIQGSVGFLTNLYNVKS